MTTETLERRTIGEELADRLRERILEGDLPPGTPLPETAIAERYGTSRPSVRDALRQLVHEGLVRHETHRGAQVARLDDRRLRDICEARLIIEPQVARRASFGEAALGALRERAGRLESAARTGDWRAYTDADIDFHVFLVGCGASRSAADFHATGMRQLRLHFTSLDRGDGRPGSRRSHVAEHRRIVDLLGSGNRPEAARLLTRHLEDARDALL
ncbi:MAG: GntR family transcriptional regulator [Gemmatimonadales bacterium]|jgi:DNA-binding GntR family transcriptional regulator